MSIVFIILGILIGIIIIRSIIHNSRWQNLAKKYPAEFLTCLTENGDWTISYTQGQTYDSITIPLNGMDTVLWIRYDGKEKNIKQTIRERILAGNVKVNSFAYYLLHPESFLYDTAKGNDDSFGVFGRIQESKIDIDSIIPESPYYQLAVCLLADSWIFRLSLGAYAESQPVYLKELGKTIYFTQKTTYRANVYRKDILTCSFDSRQIKNPFQYYFNALLSRESFMRKHPVGSSIDLGVQWVKCPDGIVSDRWYYGIGLMEKRNTSIKIVSYLPTGVIIDSKDSIYGLSNTPGEPAHTSIRNVEKILRSDANKPDMSLIKCGDKWGTHVLLDKSTGIYHQVSGSTNSTMIFKQFFADRMIVTLDGVELNISFDEAKRILVGESKMTYTDILVERQPKHTNSEDAEHPQIGSRHELVMTNNASISGHVMVVYMIIDDTIKAIDESTGIEYTFTLSDFKEQTRAL